MAYLSKDYARAYSFLQRRPEAVRSDSLFDTFCAAGQIPDATEVIVSEIFQTDGLMLLRREPDGSLRAAVTALRERSLRDLLMYLPSGVKISLTFSDDWMAPTVRTFLYGEVFGKDRRVVGCKRTHQSGSPESEDALSRSGSGISSKKDAIIGAFKALNTLKHRIEQSMFIVEGPLLVERALSDGQLVDKILCTEEFRASEKYGELTALAKQRQVPYYIVSSGLMGAVTDTRPLPGIIASVHTVMGQFSVNPSLKNQAVLILDSVANPDNLGMILRTADASGMDAVVLTGSATHYMNKNAIRGGRGAVGKIPVYVSNNDEALFRELADAQFKIYAMSARANNEDFFHLDFGDRAAFVIGNESTGIRDEIYPLCNERIRIPMVPGQSSLNVAVSAGVVLYEYVKRQFGAAF